MLVLNVAVEVERLIIYLNFKQYSISKDPTNIWIISWFSNCKTIVFNATNGLLLDTMDVVAETTGNFLIRQPLILTCVNPYAFNRHLVMGAVLQVITDVTGKAEQRTHLWVHVYTVIVCPLNVQLQHVVSYISFFLFRWNIFSKFFIKQKLWFDCIILL